MFHTDRLLDADRQGLRFNGYVAVENQLAFLSSDVLRANVLKG